MDAIMQGTTPSVTLTISPKDFSLTDVTEIELYIKNGGRTTTITMDGLTIDTDANSVTKRFSVEETAALDPRKNLTIQARFFFADGSVVGIKKIVLAVADMEGVGD